MIAAMQPNVFIIGCGSIGKRTAQLIQNKLPNSISALSHSEHSIEELAARRIKPIRGDLDNPISLTNISISPTHVFYFAPPPNSGIMDSRMNNALGLLKNYSTLKRITYISTTGIYGDHQGNWITEDSPINPMSDRAKRRLNGEKQLIDHCTKTGIEYIILRVPGIYCLEKLPIDRIQRGVKILPPEIAPFSNRIYADDLANICVTAMFDGPKNELFNVADGNPSSISDYFLKIADIFNLTKPTIISRQQADKELSPGMLSYLNESKRIHPTKLLNTLNITLRYPNLASGLQACVEERKNL